MRLALMLACLLCAAITTYGKCETDPAGAMIGLESHSIMTFELPSRG